MSASMLPFVVGAVLLLLAGLAIGLRPLFLRARHADATISNTDLNASVYRDQLGELERDAAAGLITPDEHEEARRELRRRLALDLSVNEAPSLAPRPSKRMLAGLLLVLPLTAALLYLWRGNPAALLPPTSHGLDHAQVEEMVARLAAHMEQDPSDPKGWTILARSYRAMGRLEEAQKAYGHLTAQMQHDPALLADYAELLATRANGDFEGKPRTLLAQALKLDPQYPQALALAGTDAYQRGDYAAAVANWERLLPQLPPNSEETEALRATIQEARQHLGKAAGEAAPEAVSGRVELASTLAKKAQPDDTVFIFARAVSGGTSMPLAVLRVKVRDLPKRFALDDSMAMAPMARISGAKSLRVEARVSKSGQAAPQPGDLIGTTDAVKPGTRNLVLRIDRVL